MFVCGVHVGGEGSVFVCTGRWWSAMGHHCSSCVETTSQAVYERGSLPGNPLELRPSVYNHRAFINARNTLIHWHGFLLFLTLSLTHRPTCIQMMLLTKSLIYVEIFRVCQEFMHEECVWMLSHHQSLLLFHLYHSLLMQLIQCVVPHAYTMFMVVFWVKAAFLTCTTFLLSSVLRVREGRSFLLMEALTPNNAWDWCTNTGSHACPGQAWERQRNSEGERGEKDGEKLRKTRHLMHCCGLLFIAVHCACVTSTDQQSSID